MRYQILILALLTGSLSSCAQTNSPITENVVVVELFTSEGCSSCPPADELVNQLTKEAQQQNKKVFFLNFHVDYWNKLGWKDPYSSKAWSERQYSYSRVFGDRVYTPQMVVNGADEFVGSDSKKAREAIGRLSLEKSANHLMVSKVDNGNVNYTIEGSVTNKLLYYAIVEKDLYSDIKRGENSGRKIYHESVVRSLVEIPSAAKGQFHPDLSGLNPSGKYRLIVFIQDRASMKISGAAQINW